MFNELSDSALDLVTGGERVCKEVQNLTVNGKKVAGEKVVICYDVPDAPAGPGGAPILESKGKR